MTIAISVVVNPSRLQKAILATLCIGVACLGVVIGCGMVGEPPLFARLVCALLAIILAVGGFARVSRSRHPYRLDIGGTGQIRLTQLSTPADDADNINNHPHTRGMLVTLLPDSTLWSRFMILRLQDEDGGVHALSIWQDSVPQASFRALAVACRWIAAHRFAE